MKKEEQYSEAWRRFDTKLRLANRVYEDWEKRFSCEVMNNYYEGYQWAEQLNIDPTPYVVNLVYATIEIKRPALIFNHPQYILKPTPPSADWDPESSWAKTLRKQDLLNTLVNLQKRSFTHHCDVAILDSFFYFGIVEVGYSADWFSNPNVNASLEEQLDPSKDDDYTKFKAPDIPEAERIFIKRIPAHTFRVAGHQKYSELHRFDWIGYFEFVDRNALLTTDIFYIPKEQRDRALKESSQENQLSQGEEAERNSSSGGVKIWKIWNNREKMFRIYCPEFSTLMYEDSFDFLPLTDLRYSYRRDGFYPVPPASQWKSQQDELNDSREKLREMRRRAKRIYQIQRGQLSPDEKQNLISGPDSTVIEFASGVGLQPVMPPPVDASVAQSMIISKDDFNLVAATTSEQRGVSDRTTATQASIANSRTLGRENFTREMVARWLSDIGKLILRTAIKNLQLPVWVELGSTEKLGQEVQAVRRDYTSILASSLEDGVDFETMIDVSSLSPAANEEEKRAFLEFLALMSQYPELSFSPLLIRETAYRVGYRNEKIIAELQQAAQLKLLAQVSQGQQAVGNPGNLDQRTTAAMQPPGTQEIQAQLNNQGIPMEAQ